MGETYLEIKQGRGVQKRWRWAAYTDVGFGQRRNDAICNGYGFADAETAERAARKVCRDEYTNDIRLIESEDTDA